MTRAQHPALVLFAVGLIGLGVLALIYGDFALVWQPVAAWVPGRTALAYGSGVLMLAVGAGLLIRPTVAWAVRILLPYLIVWALLKVPALVAAPKIEGVWLGEGELTALLAGGWILFARLARLREGSALAALTGEKAVRAACMLFGISLVPIGLSHLIYVQATAGYVPAWLPAHTFWAYLTGAGQIACGLGLLFSVLPRIAAIAEACMLSLFTLLVWGSAIIAAPAARLPWTAFFISWIITAAGWTVAMNSCAGKHNVAHE